MADYIIDIDTLETKKTTLNDLNKDVSTAYNSFTSSTLNKLNTTEISLIGNRVSNLIKQLKNGHDNSYSWLTSYIDDISTLENKLANAENENLNDLIEFNGTFEDIFGKVTMPVLKTGADESANASKYFVGASADGTVLVDVLNNEYIVADTPGELMDYYNNVIRGKGLYQDYNYAIYRDQCLGFAYNYAWGLYTNDRSIEGSQCRNDTSCGSNFKRYTTNSESDFLANVYNQISAGKPVVVQVIGSRSRRSRHYVAAVGFKNTVKSPSELKTTDLLIVDSYDGNIKEVVPYGASSGRYIASGTQINRSRYNYGYEMYYIDT